MRTPGKKLLSPLDMLAEMSAETAHQMREIPLTQIHPDPDQPRKEFGGEEDERFALGIKETGLAQPLLVRPHPDPDLLNDFMIVVGERRYRAAQLAGLETVPCQIRADLAPAQLAVMQLAENMGRKSLSDLEEAHGMRRVLDLDRSLSQGALARRLGCSSAYVSKQLALLDPRRVSPPTRQALEAGRLTGATNALAFEALPAETKEELLARDEPITRRTVEAAAAATRPRGVPETPAQAPDSRGRRDSGTPATADPTRKKAPGRPPMIERHITAALVWNDWVRLFKKLGGDPPASSADLQSALRRALED